MSSGKGKSRKRVHRVESMQVKNPNAAGIDIGSDAHYVAIPSGRTEEHVKRFGCFTRDLHALAEWLKENGIETVAMESTGVYWIPLFQILECSGFDVFLVNARHVKNVPGRKTDVLDCQWLQQLHSYGLLQSSFRPDDSICVLRSYVRQRSTLIKCTSSHIQRMQKALDQMNIHLHRVISDLTGVTGMRIIEAIIHGERNPVKLARLRDGRIKAGLEDIIKSLEGDWRAEHLFVLQQEYELYQAYRKKIDDCESEITRYLSEIERQYQTESSSPSKSTVKPSKRCRVSKKYDLKTHFYNITGVDFTKVDGFDTLTIQTLVSECGVNPDKWPSENHFASWLGLCPNAKITGGVVKSSSTRKVVNRASTALRMSAQSLSHSKSALGAYYRRMKSRLGAAKATTAVAHKLARIYYRMLKYGKEYVDQGQDYYDKRYKERILKSLNRKAHDIGFKLVEIQAVTGDVS